MDPSNLSPSLSLRRCIFQACLWQLVGASGVREAREGAGSRGEEDVQKDLVMGSSNGIGSRSDSSCQSLSEDALLLECLTIQSRLHPSWLSKAEKDAALTSLFALSATRMAGGVVRQAGRTGKEEVEVEEEEVVVEEDLGLGGRKEAMGEEGAAALMVASSPPPDAADRSMVLFGVTDAAEGAVSPSGRAVPLLRRPRPPLFPSDRKLPFPSPTPLSSPSSYFPPQFSRPSRSARSLRNHPGGQWKVTRLDPRDAIRCLWGYAAIETSPVDGEWARTLIQCCFNTPGQLLLLSPALLSEVLPGLAAARYKPPPEWLFMVLGVVAFRIEQGEVKCEEATKITGALRRLHRGTFKKWREMVTVAYHARPSVKSVGPPPLEQGRVTDLP